VCESGGQPLFTRLQAELGEKQLLLLLDNFEQVAAAAPIVADEQTSARRRLAASSGSSPMPAQSGLSGRTPVRSATRMDRVDSRSGRPAGVD
jgi:hypothetical protein